MKYINLFFCAALIAISAGLTACNTTCASAQSPSSAVANAPKKDITLQLYSLRSDMKNDPKGTIKKAGEMGYTAVEAAGYSDGKFYGMTPEEFKAEVEKAGMKVRSSHTSKKLSPYLRNSRKKCRTKRQAKINAARTPARAVRLI